jgi:phosphomannomutase/phosphoglucomutase
MKKEKLNCFKAYDIRGKVPSELNAEIAYKIGIAYAKKFHPKSIIIGYDGRLESPEIAKALSQGLLASNVDVINIGLCGTEEVYFQTFFNEKNGVDGGVMITASHNPKGYNGMKLVQKGSRPISNDSGLSEIHDMVLELDHLVIENSKHPTIKEDKTDYINHLMSYIDPQKLKPLKVVVNPGNGTAGLVVKLLQKHLPFEFIYLHENVDGNFPHGVPNPLLVENRKATRDAVITHNADLGIAWDGDFDRCFLFDEKGDFIEGYYIVGLLAEAFLKKNPGEKIIYDPRLTWNTIDTVQTAGGIPIQSKTGHAFIKERMRSENAVYGGEMSAHHYFRDFAYCDSGMIPWLLITEMLCEKGEKLSSLLNERIALYPCSGEINYSVSDSKTIIQRIFDFYEPLSPIIDRTDGLGLSFDTWRLNIRTSNTEPLLRLNIESKRDQNLVLEKVKEIESMIF